jgi:hypothetical protein
VKEVRRLTSVQEVGEIRALKEELVVMERLLKKPKGWMLRSREHAVRSLCRRIIEARRAASCSFGFAVSRGGSVSER